MVAHDLQFLPNEIPYPLQPERNDASHGMIGACTIAHSLKVDRSMNGIEVITCPDDVILLPAWFNATLEFLRSERPSDVSACVMIVPDPAELDISLYEGPLDLRALPPQIRLIFVAYDRKIAIMLGMLFALHPVAHIITIVHTIEEAMDVLR